MAEKFHSIVQGFQNPCKGWSIVEHFDHIEQDVVFIQDYIIPCIFMVAGDRRLPMLASLVPGCLVAADFLIF